MIKDFLWVEKYRPRTVKDTILPASLKKQFQSFVDAGNIPGLILSGGPGCGKTTVAKAMLEELGCDYIMINGSMNGGIDTLRDDIQSFASSVSFTGGRKYVILDEADHLTQHFQPALRSFAEEFSANCGFILTCNFPEKIIEPLHSRATLIEFKIPKEESPKLAKEFLTRVKEILDNEGIEYEMKVLAEFIMRHFPDWRRVLNELQSYGMSGKVDSGILKSTSDSEIQLLIKHLKEKDFTSMRKWVGENDVEFQKISRSIYDKVYDFLEKDSIPQAVVIIADYQAKNALSVDKEINLVAMLTELMISVSFK
jgi:DNA polymerase III delta prime subunit